MMLTHEDMTDAVRRCAKFEAFERIRMLECDVCSASDRELFYCRIASSFRATLKMREPVRRRFVTDLAQGFVVSK